METDKGNFLNVTIKNKIIQNETIYDFLGQFKNLSNKNQQKNVKDELLGRSFKVTYAKRNHKIDEIDFDRNPKNTTINYNGKTIN